MIANIEQVGELGGLVVYRGISEPQIGQLVVYSGSDPEVVRFTSDSERFQDRDAYERWLKKGRTVYTLSNGEGNLLGLIWYGAEPIPQREFIVSLNPDLYGFTSARRTYAEARGKGLAAPFSQICQVDFTSLSAYLQRPSPHFWVENSADNIPAMKLADVLGYRVVTKPDQNNKVLLVTG